MDTPRWAQICPRNKRITMSDQIENKFDTIVIGAGMSGGWAAKEFCDKGFKTLLLERGRDVKHIADYPTTGMRPWEFENRGRLPQDIKEANPIAAKCYAFREDTTHFFVKDDEHPYEQEKPFDWIRGYQVGGKSIMWARQVQRWSDYDFEGPKRDGFAVDWPIRYKDLEEWYSYVEEFVGVSGNKDGLDTLPDGEFLKAWDLNCVEEYFQNVIKENYEDRHVIYARCAHLTENKPIFKKQGRVLCQSRQICERGCPYGGYFNANSTTIPWAQRTGNLTLRPHSVVHSIIYDEEQKKAIGVKVVDEQTKEVMEFYAKVIFVNAGALNSNLILLNSKSERFPNGLGNDNGLLGKYVAFHSYRARMSATHPGHKDKKTVGGRPTSAYIPRFRNVKKQETDFIRGWAAGFGAYRSKEVNSKGVGQELLDNLNAPKEMKPWKVGSHMMGETIPKEDNQVTLSSENKDAWGIPLLKVDISYDDNDEKMIADYREQMTAMFEKAGFTDIHFTDTGWNPGRDIHVMGGVRMGHDPETSLLDAQNRMHLCPNVYVTDGACMTSVSTQNPSLTFMAMTARSAHFAMEELKKENVG